jgi:serine/threonine-protein phosphatase Stp1
VSIRTSSASDSGAFREKNEDRLLDRPDLELWAVADGAGGHEAGEVASEMIVGALSALPPSLGAGVALGYIRSAMDTVHTELQGEAIRRGAYRGVVSTVVTLLVRDGHFVCLWVGDSRAYLLRAGALQQVTRDHSVAQELVDMGLVESQAAMSHPQAAVITRAVGIPDDALSLDKISGALLSGDRFLLCSDGVPKVLPDGVIAELLGADPVEDIAAAMVGECLRAGARDNVTAVVVEIILENGLPGS